MTERGAPTPLTNRKRLHFSKAFPKTFYTSESIFSAIIGTPTTLSSTAGSGNQEGSFITFFDDIVERERESTTEMLVGSEYLQPTGASMGASSQNFYR